MRPLVALKGLAIFFAVIIIVLLGVLFFYNPAKAPSPSATPAIVSADGALAVDAASLQNGARVSSPLALAGTVTGGGWFFEATFPVKILDADGTLLGSTTARAESDWTSTGTVPWAASLSFAAPHGVTGTVVFANDNPSGDPSKAKTLGVPVRFQ